jgi:hypothetical protein
MSGTDFRSTKCSFRIATFSSDKKIPSDLLRHAFLHELLLTQFKENTNSDWSGIRIQLRKCALGKDVESAPKEFQLFPEFEDPSIRSGFGALEIINP